jgi:shikimate kinase
MGERGQSIVLIGFMGVGKSSTAVSLSGQTGLPLRDTDEMISSQLGLSIAEIFARLGEEAFRDEETKTLTLLGDTPGVIATGGGIILRPQNVSTLRRLGDVVWLDADQKTLWRRIGQSPARPILKSDDDGSKFLDLLRVREPLYRNTADVRVDTSLLTPDQVADAILRLIKRL